MVPHVFIVDSAPDKHLLGVAFSKSIEDELGDKPIVHVAHNNGQLMEQLRAYSEPLPPAAIVVEDVDTASKAQILHQGSPVYVYTDSFAASQAAQTAGFESIMHRDENTMVDKLRTNTGFPTIVESRNGPVRKM